ncbi:hypothetical protein [Limobrevibacterium gyesilva]|uniref:Uncharacterized protein n=1 Tax=Limobrevibacterium gyesilva TaxID=2991712 RepID=A0AA41YSG7_9PROT|nr:hypothetical protein [Limobrevibacterium gyesilva]MCW3477493.1 hypothetical protein [Limobrevibacterium gyesilva]
MMVQPAEGSARHRRRPVTALFAVAVALTACVPPPPPPHASPAAPPPPQAIPPKHVAAQHKVHRTPPTRAATQVKPICPPTDSTGLSAAQKEHLFQRFDTWQVAHQDGPDPREAHDLPPADDSGAPQACRAAP